VDFQAGLRGMVIPVPLSCPPPSQTFYKKEISAFLETVAFILAFSTAFKARLHEKGGLGCAVLNLHYS